MPDGTFTRRSKVRDVLNQRGERGRELLFKHGYDIGEGFVDVLSQYQTLQHAAETERLRDLEELLLELNSTSLPDAQGAPSSNRKGGKTTQ